MKAVNRPQITLHQGVLAELREDLEAAAEGDGARELGARAGEMLELITVLPEQLAARHFVLMQLPGSKCHRHESHDEGQRVVERDAGHLAADRLFPENQEYEHDRDDNPKERAFQPLGAYPALVELGNLPDEVLSLILYPGVIHP